MKKSILILGGDGYLGWPVAMNLSNNGYAVTVIDNYFRRTAVKSLGLKFLVDPPNLIERAKKWYELTGNEIKVKIADLSNPETLTNFFNLNMSYDWCVEKNYDLPIALIHFAEQPSAPYSLIDVNFANKTLFNNLTVTNNVMFAIKNFSKSTHIIKLGTMGEYGTPNIDIEEGWINISHKGREDTFLFPRQASSIYHTSKIMDTDLLWFGTRTWGLKVTDLMQGPVYGVFTKESVLSEDLMPFYNYDEIFGTIINRFIVQAALDYPLTVYGSGTQIRGYLNLTDTLQCIQKAILNPPNFGEMNIFNQIMETFNVNEIAERICNALLSENIHVKVKKIKNPRVEKENHYYNPTYQSLIKLGVKPNLLSKDVILQIYNYVSKFKENIDRDIIIKGIKW